MPSLSLLRAAPVALLILLGASCLSGGGAEDAGVHDGLPASDAGRNAEGPDDGGYDEDTDAGQATSEEPAPCLSFTFAGAPDPFVLAYDLALAEQQPDAGVALLATGGDPYLVAEGAVVDADLDACTVVEVTLTVALGQRAQLFWSRAGGEPFFAEARSRMFDLVADGLPHRYRIELDDHAEWTGQLVSLRLDPSDAAGALVVHSLVVRPPDHASLADAGPGGPPPDDNDAGPADGGQPPSEYICPQPGFVSTSQGCKPDAPEPFLSRSEASVCARWQADHQSVSPEWEALDPQDTCDPGVVPAAALENALVRTNLYRWLAGADAVTLDDGRFATQQACAVIQAAQGHLDHHPSESAPCYTPEGAAGAGSSNLSGGAGLAGSIDLYVGDNGIPSLGHRRWLLNPSATTTQFGHKAGFSCMYSFSNDGSANPDFMAWPPPGYVPDSAARGTFSFSSTTLRPTEDTVVELAINDGTFSAVPFTNLGWGYGWGETVSFSPPDDLWQVWSAGTTVRVRIRNTTAGDVAWSTHFVACN